MCQNRGNPPNGGGCPQNQPEMGTLKPTQALCGWAQLWKPREVDALDIEASRERWKRYKFPFVLGSFAMGAPPYDTACAH